MTEDIQHKVEAFFSRYQPRHYTKGQVLLLAGEPVEHVIYVEAGKVKQYDVSYRGDEVILNVFKPPAFFPMSLIMNAAPSPYIFEADTDIVIRRAPAADVTAFLQKNPDVTYDLLCRVYSGMDGVLARMVHLMSGTAQSRLLHELVLECRRFGTTAADGSISIALSESDLGARAGLSRETVSR